MYIPSNCTSLSYMKKTKQKRISIKKRIERGGTEAPVQHGHGES